MPASKAGTAAPNGFTDTAAGAEPPAPHGSPREGVTSLTWGGVGVRACVMQGGVGRGASPTEEQSSAR